MKNSEHAIQGTAKFGKSLTQNGVTKKTDGERNGKKLEKLE